MSNTPRILIGPVQNLHDARYAAAVGVHALVFDTTGPYAHSMEEVKQIRDWLSGPSLLLRFGSESTAEIQQWVDALSPDAILLTSPAPITGTVVLQSQRHEPGQPVACTGKDSPWSHILVLDQTAQFDPQQDAAWWLGAFSLTADGLLDYEACDAFLQAHAVSL